MSLSSARFGAALAACLAVGAVLVSPATAGPQPAAASPLFKASSSTYGAEGDHFSRFPSVSADGRWVAFDSTATNLSDQVRTSDEHVYLKDLDTGRAVLVSADAAGVPLPGVNSTARVDGDGSTVVFRNVSDGERYYVKDIASGALTVVSVNAAGAPADAGLSSVSLNADGTDVVFSSAATNLLPQASDADADVFVKDLTTGQITLASAAADGSSADGDARAPSVSADGRLVAFTSSATNLDPRAPGAATSAVFVKDLLTGAVTLASCDQACTVAATGSSAHLSPAGTHVVFGSADSFGVPGTNGVGQVWVKDLATGQITLASATAAGRPGDAVSSGARISGDGQQVVFASSAQNFVAGGTLVQQVYRKDLRTGRLLPVSQYGGRLGFRPAAWPDISATGGTTVFHADKYAFLYDAGFDSHAIYVARAGRTAPVYPPPGGSYTSVTATRILDTRSGLGVPAAGIVTPASPVRLTVTGRGGVPVTGVSAVALNVSVVTPAGNGFLTGYAGGAVRPATALLNYPAAATRAALAVLPVAPDGTVSLYTSQRTHLMADVEGWFSTPETASMTEGRWQELVAKRIVDTRQPGSPVLAIGPGQKVDVDVETLGQLPRATKTVILNVSAVGSTGSGYLTVYPYLQPRPVVSTLSFRAAETVSNRVIVPLVQRRVSIYNSSGTTNLLVDVAGFSTTGDVPVSLRYSSWYVPVPGTRILDTRSGVGGPSSPLGPAATITLNPSDVRSLPRVYGAVHGVVGTLAGLDATAAGYLTTTLFNGAPNGSNDVHVAPGPPVSNAVFSNTDSGQRLTVHNAVGSTNVILDVNGAFVCGAYCLLPPGP